MATAIDVRELTKRYDTVVALDRISFQVSSGDIMGFLGPNGAGKTTTLRILTGLLAPTSGSVQIDGLGIDTKSLEVRRRIGYLPENVALYPELRVQEYLAYRALIKNVPRSERGVRLSEVLERCAVGDVRRQLIGRLSKGYRQRVALADCLIGRPSILILDEPTVGLDPNQIRQTRELIKQLGAATTILLSTHILPEVETLCHRVTIINKGAIVAVDTPENLRRSARGKRVVHVEVRADGAQAQQALGALPGVAQVSLKGSQHGISTLDVEADTEADVREAIFSLAVARQWTLRQLAQTQTTLEDVFVHLTTKEQDTT